MVSRSTANRPRQILCSQAMMEPMSTHAKAFEEFKGPMAQLISQVQQREIEIFDLSLATLARQFQPDEKSKLTEGAKFIAGLSHLMYLKAYRLLPVEEELQVCDELCEIVPHDLQEYSAFKEIAGLFSVKEREQSDYFWRYVSFDAAKTLDLPVLHPPMPLEEFSRLFHKMLGASVKRTVHITEDAYKIVDMLDALRKRLQKGRLSFDALFISASPKLLLIATFLAVLELLKNQKVILYTELET